MNDRPDEPGRTRFRQGVQGELPLELFERRHCGPAVFHLMAREARCQFPQRIGAHNNAPYPPGRLLFSQRMRRDCDTAMPFDFTQS